jgi:hypothetical protein
MTESVAIPEITLTLTVHEIDFILSIFGDLPTKSNAYPLAMKIREQALAQVPPPETNNPEE